MISQTRIIECLEIFRISVEIVNFITKTMENWSEMLAAGAENLADVKENFQIDSSSS